MRNGEFWGISGNFKNLLFSYNVIRCSFNCNIIPDGELNCLFVYYVNFKHVVSVVTRIMTDLKKQILAKMVEKFRKFKSDFMTEMKNQITNELSEAMATETRK